MDTIRLNITLPRQLVQQLDKLVGARKKSSFIADALTKKIETIQKKELQSLLEEGYKSNKQEGLATAKEFDLIDVEGWDEY